MVVRLEAMHELLLELGVPVVLDVVVRPPGQLRCDDRPPACIHAIQRSFMAPIHEEILLITTISSFAICIYR